MRKLCCCVPPTLTLMFCCIIGPIGDCIVIVETFTLVLVPAGFSVITWGSRLSMMSPTGNVTISAHKKKPRLSQKKPAHQPIKQKYSARTKKPGPCCCRLKGCCMDCCIGG